MLVGAASLATTTDAHSHYRIEMPKSDPRRWENAQQWVAWPPGNCSCGRGAQVIPINEQLIHQPVTVEQNHRIVSIGVNPTKWAGDTPLSAFKMDLILHFRATKLPK